MKLLAAIAATFALLATNAHATQQGEAIGKSRQEESRGLQLLKSADGGAMRLTAPVGANEKTISELRRALRANASALSKGDISPLEEALGGSTAHTNALKVAARGDLTVSYQDVSGGGEIVFSSTSKDVVNAIHGCFDEHVFGHEVIRQDNAASSATTGTSLKKPTQARNRKSQ